MSSTVNRAPFSVRLLGAVLTFFLLGPIAQAGEVQQIKGTKVLITLTDVEANVGTYLFIVNSEGKKIGIIQVKQIKNGRAIAELTKGRGEVGASVQGKSKATSAPTPSASESNDESEETTAPRSSSARKKISLGVLGGMTSSSFAMDMGPTAATTVCPTGNCRDAGSLSGTSYNLKFFGDYDLSKALTIRVASGLETLSAKGTIARSLCTGNTNSCSVSINYLALEGGAHYNFLTGSTRAWIGLGYSFLIAMSTSTTIPNLSTSGGTNQMILFGLGADFGLKKGAFIPLVLEYGMFPGSSDVKATSYFLRSGYGWAY
jgi:hypothetical protein